VSFFVLKVIMLNVMQSFTMLSFMMQMTSC
jgi:hypothetical protein